MHFHPPIFPVDYWWSLRLFAMIISPYVLAVTATVRDLLDVIDAWFCGLVKLDLRCQPKSGDASVPVYHRK